MKKTRKIVSLLLAFCMLLTVLPGITGLADSVSSHPAIPAAYSALDDFLASASEHQFEGYSIDDIGDFIEDGGQIYQDLRVQYEDSGTITYKVPVQDSEIDYLMSLQNRSIQPYSAYPFPVTKIRDSGRPDKDSIVIILMGDGFTEEQYGTWPHPAEGTVLHYANDAINTMLNTHPYSLFADLFTVYVIHAFGVNPDKSDRSYLGSVAGKGDETHDSKTAQGGELARTKYLRQAHIRELADALVPANDQNMIQIISNAAGGRGYSWIAWYNQLGANISVSSLRNDETPIGGSDSLWPDGTSWQGTFIHEFGHSFGGLTDEFEDGRRDEEYANSTSAADADVKWRHWAGYRNVLVTPERYSDGWAVPAGYGCIMRGSWANRNYCGVCAAELIRRLADISGEPFYGRGPRTNDPLPDTPTVTIPKGTARILDSAFHGNTSLQTIDIPSSVSSIGDYAFIGATGLTKVVNHSLLPQEINETTFAGVDLSKVDLYVPAESMAAYFDAGWTGFRNMFAVPPSVIYYNANGGSGAPASQTKIYDVDLVLSTVRPQKDNAFFLGWATSPTAKQPEYQPGDIYSAEANIILYAVYADVTNLAITADGVAGADGTILSAGDVNVYKFTAPKSGSYQIYFSTINGGITGIVYDADIEPVNHTLSYYDLTGGRDYYVEVINQTAGKSLYSLHIDMSTESYYYIDASEGNVWLANDFYGNLYSDFRSGTLFRIDKASMDGSLEGYTISADRMYDFYDHNITIPASSPQYLTYTPSTLTTPDPAGGKASMEPYSGTGGQRWDISRLPNSNEYFITSTEGTLEQLLILNTQMPRPFMVNKTAYSSCQEARFTFSGRVDLPVADGSYRIANQNTDLFLGMSDSGAVQNENQDIWDIEWQDDGFYKIYWHSDPNQVLTYDADEKAVILGADSGQNSQRWKIARCADGSMRISPASSSQILVVRDAANAGAKILLQNDAFDSTGKWSFTQVITDGIYEIQGKTSGKLIHAEHTLNGAPAHLWQPAETLYQKMRFELLDDGAYRITMLSGDGRVLTNPQSLANGAELQFRDWTGENYQRWFVIDCGDGYFKLQNKYSKLVVDISENGTANDTKIQQWADAGVDAQRFKLLRTNLPYTSIILNDSTYEIQGKTSQKLIHAANWPNGSPAHLWESADINLQKMHFELQDDGTYRITVLNGNGGVLTNPESYTDGTQLLFSAWTGGDHQRWYVVDLGNGYVKLINKFSGMAIDISENGTANGTKVQQWKDKNTDTAAVDAQQFRLLPTDLPFESMDLANGTYEIQAASGKLLHAADWTDGSKAHLWESVENNPLQTMHFERQSDGTYEITVDATGKLLTNPYSYVNGTQLEFSSQAHDDHQKWYVVDDGDGYVTLINKFSGLAIDVSESGTANGTRIQQWQDTGVSAQRFRLIPIA